MRHWLACFGMLALATSGCAICADPHDCKFAAYGGGRQRTDMVHGRVASVFDPAPEINRFANAELPPIPEDQWEPPRDDDAAGGTSSTDSGDGTAGSGRSEDSGYESNGNDLPDLDGEGSIELPDLDGGDQLPELPRTESPDDDPNSLRSAWRNPLSDLDAEF